MQLLIRGIPLPVRYGDHALRGDWYPKRDCHIEGDWLLLYQFGVDDEGNELVIFLASDTHENLFG